MTPRPGRALALLLAGSAAAAVLAWLPVSSPAVGSWAELERWYVEAGAAAAITGARLAGLAAAAWVALLGALHLVAGVAGWRPLVRLADALSPRGLRWFLHGAATLSLSAGLVPALPAGPPGGRADVAVMVPLDLEPPSTSPTTATSSPTTAPSAPPPAAPDPDPGPAVTPTREVVVERGDSFWSIASRHAGDADVVAYWRALIERNRQQLVDPANPDLLFPAQVLRLP